MKEKLNWVNVIKYAGAYIAFIIGSGFATGQEIMQFYTSYGWMSIGSIFISMIIFAWMGGTLTSNGYQLKGQDDVNSYVIYCGKYLGTFLEYFVRIVLFLVVVVMISGAGATLNEYYGINHYVGSFCMALLVFVSFAFGFNKLIDIIGCIGPVIIVFSIIVAVGTFILNAGNFGSVDTSSIESMQASSQWWFSGILYPAYNIFGSVAFLTTLGQNADSEREVRFGGYLGGVLLMIAVLFMNIALILKLDVVASLEVPTLKLASDISPILGVIFSIVLLCGIFSTAAPMMWTVCTKFAPAGTKKATIFAAICSVVAFILGQFSFGTLVSIVYPYTGYVGIILIVCVLYKVVKEKLFNAD